MAPNRLVALAGVLLATLMFSAVPVCAQAPVFGAGVPFSPAQTPPLPGNNSISGLVVKQDADDIWYAEVDYYYIGVPRGAWLMVELDPPDDHQSATGAQVSRNGVMITDLARGKNHVRRSLGYPVSPVSADAERQTVTRHVVATIFEPGPTPSVSARQSVDAVIEWPDYQTYYQNYMLARQSPAENLARVVDLIDTNDEGAMAHGKTIALRLIAKDPKYEPAYIQLARIAMRTNQSPEGFRQAESLLDTALRIRPESADAKILLGYVYLQQERLAEAEKMLVSAAKANPPNLWLFANWGDVLSNQGRNTEAIAKYREALARPLNHNPNDRARVQAYRQLIGFLRERQDLDGMEALYKRQIEDFGPGSCYSKDYAQFLLNERGDPQGAIDLAKRALNKECDDAPAREVLGIASYVKWAAVSGPEGEESLNQGHLYMPIGPTLFYRLALSERTTPTIGKLLRSGEPIDQKDAGHMTALGYALQNRSLAAIGRLLKLGASPETKVGESSVPAALLAVMAGDVESTRLLVLAGVDFSKLRFAGVSALEIARQSGNSDLIALLSRKGVAL
jgi:tetratricopeptide (TPR) repeat protein